MKLHQDQKQCRICLDDEHPDGIISPCLCSGNSAYVHRDCLNNWRSMNKNGKGFKACDICQFEYIIETVNSNPEEERKRLLKYYLYVSRDLLLLILLIQLIVLGVAYILKRTDKDSHNIQNLFPTSISGFLVYYLSAVTLLLALIGFIALVLFCYAVNCRDFMNNNSFRNSSSNGKGVFALIVGVVMVFALIGLFVGIGLSVYILKEIMKHHSSKLWLRQEAEKYIVKDFQGRRKELEKYKNNNRTTTDASVVDIDHDICSKLNIS